MVTSVDNCILKTNAKTDPRFIVYQLSTREYLEFIESIARGGTRPRISRSMLGSIGLLLPPLSEQRAIASFLDVETSKIDTLVKKKERLIELLQEKRTAMISHAVTKGLNPAAPLKDSGVDWLGQIPKGWQALRIATFSTKITNGYVGPTRDILRDKGVRYLQSLHVKNGNILFDRGHYFVDEAWSKAHSKSVLGEGDVLIVQTGAETGQCAVVTKEFEGCNCHALIIVSSNRGMCYGPFLLNVLLSDYGRQALHRIQTGALHPHLNCTLVRDVMIPVPPIAEQVDIVDAINSENAKLDALIAKVTLAIERLREYRTALISAAVTGKIDVRREG